MTRFGFTIRTRGGQRVDNLSMLAGARADAERRLRQMYPQCEILDCREQDAAQRVGTGARVLRLVPREHGFARTGTQ